jgi:hypothetical protein
MTVISNYHKRLLSLIGQSILLLTFVFPFIFKIYWEIEKILIIFIGVGWPITQKNAAIGLGLGFICLVLALHTTFNLLEYINK